MTDLQAIFDEIEAQDLLEDRREYAEEDLARMYALTSADAAALHYMIKNEFRGDAKRLGHTAEQVGEMIAEAEHENFEGWTFAERATIMRFLDDIHGAIENSK